MNYPTEKLGNHIQVLSGFAFKSKDFSDTGIPVIKIKNITPPSVSLIDLSYVPEEIADQNRKFILSYDDVLIALTGSHINQMASVVGRVAKVKYSEKTVLNQRVGKITVNDSDDCDLDFVYYYLSQDKVKIELASKAGGAANQANISPTDIKNLMFPFPNIDVQRKIASVLRTYDDLIENNQKQIKLLEEAAQRLYKEWFIDLRFPGHETTPIVDGVPEGWCVSSVGDCSCFLRRGISPKYNEEGSSIVINQKCIRQSVVDLNEARRQEKSFDPEMNLNDSDTVICSTGAGTLGRVGQVFGQQPNTTFDSHVTLVRASNIVGRQYLYHFLKSKQQYLQGMGKGSTNQLELNRATIQELVLLIPSVKTQNAFECQAQPIHDQITTLTKQIALLQEARDKLLPKLMRGELENEDF